MDNVSDWTLRKNVLCLRYAARNFAIVTSPMCVFEDEAGWKLEWEMCVELVSNCFGVFGFEFKSVLLCVSAR